MNGTELLVLFALNASVFGNILTALDGVTLVTVGGYNVTFLDGPLYLGYLLVIAVFIMELKR